MAITISGNGDMTGDYTFAGDVDVNGKLEAPAGDTASRPATGQAGEIRFNTDTGKMEYWSTTSDTPQWLSVGTNPINIVSIEYLAIAGGGGGASQISNYGGYAAGTNGENTRFGSVIAIGGGGGAKYGVDSAGDGGSGGGAASGTTYSTSPGAGTTGQGYAGGNGYGSYFTGGGGGGAGGVGDNADASQGGDGGPGLASTIITTTQSTTYGVGEVSGNSVYFAGGGAGCGYVNQYGSGVGGVGGGGDGIGLPSATLPPNQNTNALPNSGGGGGAYDNGGAGHGGGGAGGFLTGTINLSTDEQQITIVGAGGTNLSGEAVPQGPVCRGGSGVLILKYDSSVTCNFIGTFTQNTFTSGSHKISIIKATSGDTYVSFSK